MIVHVDRLSHLEVGSEGGKSDAFVQVHGFTLSDAPVTVCIRLDVLRSVYEHVVDCLCIELNDDGNGKPWGVTVYPDRGA